MPNLSNITLPLEMLNGGINKFLLADKSPLFNYDSGKRTSDTPIGVKFTVALHGNKLTPVTVRIEGADPMPQLTSDIIQSKNASCNFIFVELMESVAKLYTINGEQRISATAKSATLADDQIDF